MCCVRVSQTHMPDTESDRLRVYQSRIGPFRPPHPETFCIGSTRMHAKQEYEALARMRIVRCISVKLMHKCSRTPSTVDVPATDWRVTSFTGEFA